MSRKEFIARIFIMEICRSADRPLEKPLEKARMVADWFEKTGEAPWK